LLATPHLTTAGLWRTPGGSSSVRERCAFEDAQQVVDRQDADEPAALEHRQAPKAAPTHDAGSPANCRPRRNGREVTRHQLADSPSHTPARPAGRTLEGMTRQNPNDSIVSHHHQVIQPMLVHALPCRRSALVYKGDRLHPPNNVGYVHDLLARPLLARPGGR
jgi:hypothetical protein